MPETQDDEYSALAAAIGGQVDAQFFSDAETPQPDPLAPVVPDTPEPAQSVDAEGAETPPATDPVADPADADPLKDAEPFTYKVDGEVRTIDGAQIVPGLGAIIPTEVLATVQDRLGQADRLHAINKTQYETIQRFEQAGGHEALSTLRVQNAQSEAAATVMLQTLLENGEVLAQIALADTREQKLAILNNTVLREARIAAREARVNMVDAPQQQPTIDLTVPETRDTVLTNSVAHVAQHLAASLPGLTADDIAAVTNHAKMFSSSILVPATPAQAKEAGVKPGETVIAFDLIGKMLTGRAEESAKWRTSQQELAAKMPPALKENQARLAAAGKARTTPAPRAVPNATPATSDPSWQQIKDKWAAGEFATASE